MLFTRLGASKGLHDCDREDVDQALMQYRSTSSCKSTFSRAVSRWCTPPAIDSGPQMTRRTSSLKSENLALHDRRYGGTSRPVSPVSECASLRIRWLTCFQQRGRHPPPCGHSHVGHDSRRGAPFLEPCKCTLPSHSQSDLIVAA